VAKRIFTNIFMSIRIALIAASLFALAPAAAAQTPLRVDLNIPALRIVVYEGDVAIRSYPVSVGMLGHDTPTGSFDIDHAEWNPWWRPPAREWARNDKVTPPGPNNPMGRVKLYFEPLYFVHGTPESESIGTPASHGCVRMLNEDVIALARLLHERAAPEISDSDIDRILRSGGTRRVNFDNAIPLRVRYDPVEVANGELRVHPDIYRRDAIHPEGVYQALMAAGYDVSNVELRDVRRLVEAAKDRDATYVVALSEAFGGTVAANAAATAMPAN
jgi:murein L,D-transpeptidase YcbB/YkuD